MLLIPLMLRSPQSSVSLKTTDDKATLQRLSNFSQVMKIKCRENLEVETYHHPHYQSLNEKLMDDFSKINFYSHEKVSDHTNIKGSQFGFGGKQLSLKPNGVTLIENWVEQIIRNKLTLIPGINFATWAARLDKGQQTLEHDHLFYATFAFVYFVNAPKGSSPLIFTTSGKKIKAESGKLVLFPAPLRHKVPVNKCDNRVTIASNITMMQKGVA